MNFSQPHFAEPQWLLLALLGPLALLGLQWYSAWRRSRQLEKIAAAPFLAGLTKSHSPWRRIVKHGLLVLSVAGIGLALARPQWGQREEGGQVLGEDIVFLLDCSRSMLAADVLPNRLQRARLAIQDFMTRHTRSRLGLVAFAGQAFLQCPLTFDYGAFDEALRAVDDKTIPIPGTDIGAALEEGFRAMDKGEREKLLVVLTDGEDLEKGGVRTAQNLAKQGVLIYTIGIGTPAGAEIQVYNDQGKPELLRDPKGEVVRSKLDEATLRQIAQAAHGAYYPLGPIGEGLGKVRSEIENRNAFSGFAPSRKLGVDRFHVFVAAVLLLLVAESVLGTRRRWRSLSGPALVWWLACLCPISGNCATNLDPALIARLEPVPPCPALVAAALTNQIPLDQIDPFGPGEELNPGDSITALVTLCEKRATRTQWLVHLLAVLPDAKEAKAKTNSPMVLYTSLGSKLEFKPAPAFAIARTFGPYQVATGRGKPPKAKERAERLAVDKGSLALGLDRAASVILRLREGESRGNLNFGGQPFSEADIAKSRKLAEQANITTDDERALCGAVPALMSYFSVAQQTPSLQDIMMKIMDMPSIWSVIRHGGVTANLMFKPDHFSPADLTQWGLPTGPGAYHFPMRLDINGQAALDLTLVVTSPLPPFLACGGIVGLLAENPADKDEYMTMRIISARRAKVSP